MIRSSRLAFHELLAELRIGDLHPGGTRASAYLLEEVAKHRSARVLEVGAGIGLTTQRMLARGLDVTAIEPSAVMRRRFRARVGFEAHAVPFEGFAPSGPPYDAIVGESVFYALDPRATFANAHRLLGSEGVFAFGEMLCTDAARDEVVAFVHDLTNNVFGIPMVPRRAITWPEWNTLLGDAGFRRVAERVLEPAEARDEGGRTVQAAKALLVRPWLLSQYMAYRGYNRIAWAPSSWFESRVGVWKKI